MAHTPSSAAQLCEVSTNTIRLWCKQYHAHLSDSATPAPGDPRVLTDRDLSVLKYISQLRSEGLQQPQIEARLAETSIGTLELSTPQEPAISPVTELPGSPAETTNAALVATLQNIADRMIDATTRRDVAEVGRLRNDVAQLRAWLVVVSLVVVTLLIAVVVLLISR